MNEIKGRIVSISQELTVGKITKKECIIETKGEYPKNVCVEFIGDKQKLLDGKSVGSDILVSINIASREYNGKWYTNVTGYKIQDDFL